MVDDRQKNFEKSMSREASLPGSSPQKFTVTFAVSARGVT
jgi:hypothetical protein